MREAYKPGRTDAPCTALTGACILLTDNMGVRADMTASWLAQMGSETYVLDGGYDRRLEAGPPEVIPKPDPSQRYRRPYEGTDVDAGATQRMGFS